MNWGSLENFISMGGYGPYVWGAYGVMLAGIVAEIWLQRGRRRRALQEARRVVRQG